MILYTVSDACPSCHSTNYSELIRKPWMCLLPVARYRHCQNCNSDFLSITPISTDERRAHRRYRVSKSLLVRIRTKKPQFARIANMHMHGIEFSFDGDIQELENKEIEIDLYSCYHGKSLEGLKIEIISETTSVTRRSSHVPIKKRAIRGRLKDLTNAQKIDLQNYLDKYKIIDNKKPVVA